MLLLLTGVSARAGWALAGDSYRMPPQVVGEPGSSLMAKAPNCTLKSDGTALYAGCVIHPITRIARLAPAESRSHWQGADCSAGNAAGCVRLPMTVRDGVDSEGALGINSRMSFEVGTFNSFPSSNPYHMATADVDNECRRPASNPPASADASCSPPPARASSLLLTTCSLAFA